MTSSTAASFLKGSQLFSFDEHLSRGVIRLQLPGSGRHNLDFDYLRMGSFPKLVMKNFDSEFKEAANQCEDFKLRLDESHLFG